VAARAEIEIFIFFTFIKPESAIFSTILEARGT
jgi:hypothetical protein